MPASYPAKVRIAEDDWEQVTAIAGERGRAVLIGDLISWWLRQSEHTRAVVRQQAKLAPPAAVFEEAIREAAHLHALRQREELEESTPPPLEGRQAARSRSRTPKEKRDKAKPGVRS